MSTTKMKSFVRGSLAFLVGDDNKVTAEKRFRKAVTRINSQLAALAQKSISDEEQVEAAAERLEQLKYGVDVTDTYLAEILNANEQLKRAQANQKSTEASVEFYKKLLAEFEAEVEG